MSLRKDSIYGIGKKNRKNSEKGLIFADNGKIYANSTQFLPLSANFKRIIPIR